MYPMSSEQEEDNEQTGPPKHRKKKFVPPPPKWPYKLDIDLKFEEDIPGLGPSQNWYYVSAEDEEKEEANKPRRKSLHDHVYLPPPFGFICPRCISRAGYGMGGLLAPRFPIVKEEALPGPGHYETSKVTKLPNKKSKIQECRSAFGVSHAVPRLPDEESTGVPGVGFYEPDVSVCRSIERFESFGGSRSVKPGVVTVCMVDGGERCCECDQEQLADYYRSKKKLDQPNSKRQKFMILCRSCYCKAVNGDLKSWDPKDLQSLFHKARHCSFIHDHQKLRIFLSKTSCKEVHRLTRKEIVLNKYYKDCCPPKWAQVKGLEL